ncbi:MAG: PIN domain-containing protein [bacterium]|nr:PIN domain-containing protein [bacterium]
MKKYRIYLDVCCLNRPFDDQTQDRIRLEAESIIIILSNVEVDNWTLVSSEVVDFEISRILDEEKKQKVRILSSMAKEHIVVTDEIEKRAIELEKLGFSPYDALHIACAEKAKVDVLLTTDDKLLRKALNARLLVEVRSPIEWLLEVIKSE